MTTPELAEVQGLEVVGYHDLEGHPGFKMAMQEVAGRWYLYVANFWRSGWTILDVTDPAAPEIAAFIPGPEQTWTLQVQVADGLLLTSLQRPPAGWGFDPSKTEAVGVLVWDVATDPVAPRLLSHFVVGGRGTHRNFYGGGRYAYLTANPAGYHDNILMVLDLEDPTNPREVSRWWWPGQWIERGETPDQKKYFHGPAYVDGDTAYLSYGTVGMVIMDVSDPSAPEFLNRVTFGNFGASLGCHSAVPYGGKIVVANSEAIQEGEDEPINFAVTIDVEDRGNPRILGWLPVPQISSGQAWSNYTEKGGRFGPHNQHHQQGQACLADEVDTVRLAYFNAGLRVFDISDPRNPVETAYLVPANPSERRGALPERLVTQTEDVIVDRRGYTYCTDKNHGLFILRDCVPTSPSSGEASQTAA